MFKRITTVLLFGGLIGLVPTAAQANPAHAVPVVQSDPAPVAGYDLFHHASDDDDHYRCMYRCNRRWHGDHRHRYQGHRRYCWYRDDWGWYKARCRGWDSHEHDTQ